MDFSNVKKKGDVEYDRLSSLPNDLIHKILSFNGTKHAVETSVLSSRWRFIWTSMPCLDFSSDDFPTLHKFSKFVAHVLSCRNNKIEVSSVKLSFCGKASHLFVKGIIDYASSHNVQEMTITCLHANAMVFPLSLFSSRSLKYLSLAKTPRRFFITPTSTLELPELTTLYLHDVTLCDDKFIGLFSKCANLKNLTLNGYKTMGSNGFSICHHRLSNLTLENCLHSCYAVNVVAPQLENLTIKNCRIKLGISAPHLVSLVYKGFHPLQLSTDGFHSLEKVDICVSNPSPFGTDAHQFFSLLQQLHSVKFLTLNWETVKLLFSSMDLIARHSSPFANLKRLKIYPSHVSLTKVPNAKVTMSNEVKNYFLESSPSATLTMVSHEEIRALLSATSARKLMEDLQFLLEKLKANIDTSKANIDQEKAQIENTSAQHHNRRSRMAQIDRYWEDLNVQTSQGKSGTRQIMSLLRKIERLLKNVPTSQKAKLQARFSSLCSEADITMKKIIDHMKIQFDKKQSNISGCFHELDTTSQSSS